MNVLLLAGLLATQAGPMKPEVLWKAKVGLVHYRANLVVDEGLVIVPSNGEDWKSKNDGRDGLHLVALGSGALEKKITPRGKGEHDVNGVALLDRDLVFGTDEGLVLRVQRSGTLVWSRKLGGDIESPPALADLNGDRTLDVVVGVEGGPLVALNGKDGKTLWQLTGKESDYGARGFFGGVALADVNGDGAAEVFAPGKDGVFYVVDGKSGRLVWTRAGTSSRNGAPLLVDADGDGDLDVLFTEAYSVVTAADAATGEVIFEHELEHPGMGIEGLFGAVGWLPSKRCVLVGTAWWKSKEGVYCVGKEGVVWRYTEQGDNITSGFVIGDIDGKPGAEIVFGTESGKVIGLDSDGKLVMQRYLDDAIEATPLLVDVDRDGRTDILAVDHNGTLWALKGLGREKPLFPYFRGDMRLNDGRF